MGDYAAERYAELAALCKERSLPHTGKRTDLVKRLKDFDAKGIQSITVSNNDQRVKGLRISDLYEAQMVTIYAGPDRRLFNVPRPVICNLSKYFRAAFDGGFVEEQTGVIELEDVEDWVMETFVIWLHTRELCYQPFFNAGNAGEAGSWDEDNNNPPESGHWRWTWRLACLIEMYIFADHYDTKALRNTIMTNMVKEHRAIPRVLPYIAQLKLAAPAPVSSKLHKFLVDVLAIRTWPQKLKDSSSQIPSAILGEVCSRLKDGQVQAADGHDECAKCRSDSWAGRCGAHPDPEAILTVSCRYHEHDLECPAAEREDRSGW